MIKNINSGLNNQYNKMETKFIRYNKLIENKFQRNFQTYHNNFNYNQWFLNKIQMKYNNSLRIIMLEINQNKLDLNIQNNFYNGGSL